MPESVDLKAADFGQQISQGSLFLSKAEDIEREQSLLPYAHYIRQAWNELSLNGMLCVDGRPTVYFCKGPRFTTEQKRNKHRFVWNQGLVPLLILLTPD